MAGPRIAPSLAGYIPPGPGSGPQVVPRRGILDELENLSYGIGQGQVAQLEGLKALFTQPAQTITGLYRAATNPRATIAAMAADTMQKARGGPIGVGQLVGEMMSPRSLLGVNAAMKAMQKPGLLELTTYHGSPRRFTEFDAGEIGTGEGAQVYGQGTYLAESRDVASEYAMAGRSTGFTNRDSVPQFAQKALAQARGDRQKAVELLQRELAKTTGETKGANLALAIQNVKSGAAEVGLYTVDLPDDMVERMIDWDKPINEQSKPVLDALEKAGINTQSTALAGPMARGQEAHLAKHGIPGIKYFDGNSRANGQGTRNFVVFPGEEKRLRILKRE